MLNLSSRTRFFFCFLLLLCPTLTLAESPVIINEIAWMGTSESSSNEWVELYNLTDSKINLNGWKITNNSKSLNVILNNSIAPHGFYLLERTDDNSVLNLKADLIYKGSLNNNGDHLKLLDVSGNLIDEVDFLSGWAFGDNETKQTMERKNDLTWQTSKNVDGTPKIKNSEIIKQKEIMVENTSTKNTLKNESKISFIKIFLISIVICLFLTIIMLIIKKTLKQNHVRT